MSKNLVIVESPAKARTLEKYLGREYAVLASYGHVRDLVPKDGAVDPDQDFAMRYEVIKKNGKHVTAIARALKTSAALYLATDPDREGEAISWHLFELLKDRGVLDGKPVHRVVFHEITRRAVQDAIEHPRSLSNALVNAQQARRAMDYLVGFNLSPLLWRKIKPGLSAGRVQSPALRLICEREDEIEKFVAREYWTLEADCEKDSQAFTAKLERYRDRKLKQFDLDNEQDATEARSELERLAGEQQDASNAGGNLEPPDGRQLLVASVEKKQRNRNPAPPFTTSTLQQEAVRKLRFSASRAMRVAQQLYEGIDLGEGPVGLITYMRTDSVALAREAVQELREYIADQYGPGDLPERPRAYRTRSKNAQEAHEAIRPTSCRRTPEQVRKFLSEDQYRLYSLIWKRAVACQMIHATLSLVAAELACGEGNAFRATGSSIKNPGFIKVYQEGLDDTRRSTDERMLPPLEKGDWVRLHAIRAEQHFTEPPPRFTEASLVKTLEEFGIGRPSTYASIISTLQSREYAELESRRFTPTDMGRLVNGFLTQHFTQYVDYDFTAHLEDDLDEIARGEKEWVPVVRAFWEPFSTRVSEKSESVSRQEAVQARELGTDPASGKPVSVRMGRYGPFVQIGTRDDDEKPRFAGLRDGQKMTGITLEEALELFRLPRELGENAQGEPVQAGTGRYGPFVKCAGKYVSIPHTISLERALEVIAEHQAREANRVIQVFEKQGIQVLNGRFGPYITNGKKNARIPKDRDPSTLTLEECEALIAAAPQKRKAARKTTRNKAGRRKTAGKRAKTRPS